MTSFRYPPPLAAVKRSILAVLCACCAATASNAEPVPAPPGQVVAHSRAATRVYRRRKGKRTAGSDAALDEPVPALRAVLHRYRTFDTSYAPCRH